ncbi:MAG TPA: hypothetical protein VEL28_14205 [Candidatus Binatia bacterium]|nr:hypothetical protein [Candidatus Binatia bacterium]
MLPGHVARRGHGVTARATLNHRIDIPTSIPGLSFEEAWQDHVEAELDGLPVHFIGLTALLTNEPAAGRRRDLSDVDELE